MPAENDQDLADATETEAANRYVRQRVFVGLVGDAIARADAMFRLEASLRRRDRAR